jgi:hypothetical protein
MLQTDMATAMDQVATATKEVNKKSPANLRGIFYLLGGFKIKMLHKLLAIPY